MLERIDAERDLVTDPEIAVCAASDAEASELSALYGIERGRISILPPGVDAVVFTPIAHEPGEDRFVFAVVGRIQPFKGQAFALEVFSRVRKSIRDGALGTQAAHAQIELRFVGTATPKAADNDYLVSIHDRINELGLDGDVTFLGALGRTETARALAEATLTLIPSLSETFGLVALESAACGTPVVTQSVGGLVESVQDGTSGLLLPDRDPEHWAETIVALLKDRARYRSMRTASRAFALDRDWQSSANRIEAFYRRLLSGRDGVPDEF
jgi:D-inositol-3-phosphate glycosyltransferase